jgi:hypothetical protein
MRDYLPRFTSFAQSQRSLIIYEADVARTETRVAAIYFLEPKAVINRQCKQSPSVRQSQGSAAVKCAIIASACWHPAPRFPIFWTIATRKIET